MISGKFIKSSVIYSVVGALPYASGFLLLPWFAAYLSPEQFGINALYIALMYFIQILTGFGLDMSVGVLYFDYRDEREKLRGFLGTVFLSMTAIGAFTFLVFFMGGFRVFNLVFKSADVLVFLPFGIFTILSGILNSIFKSYSSLLISQERPGLFLRINLLNFALTIGASLGILYAFPYTLYGPTLGRLVPAVISSASCLVLLTTEYGLRFDPTYLRKLLRYAYPLLIYSLLTWTLSYLDRFIILRMLGNSVQVGIFDFGIKLVLFNELLLAGLVNSINPKIYATWKESGLRESTPEINRYYHGMMALFLLLIPVFVLLAPPLIPLVIHKTIYYEVFGFLAILASAYVTRIWFYMFLAPLMFFKRTSALPRIILISALFNILCAVVMIHFFGLMGAVWTSFLVKPVQALLMWLESRKVYTFRMNLSKIIYAPLAFVMVVVVSELFVPAEWRVVAEVGQLIAAVVLVWLAYRHELGPFVSKILKR